MPDGRTIALGDIHGCSKTLTNMLAALKLRDADRLVVLGDTIDRGPDSRGVIEQLVALGQQCRLIAILGNHEQMLLDVVDGKMPRQDWLAFGGAETLDSYGEQSSLAAVADEHVAFIRTWGDYHESGSHFFVHGNYRERLPLAKQPWDELRWESLHVRTPRPHRSQKIAVVGHTANKQGRIVNLGHLVCIDTYCHGGGWLTALEPVTGKIWQADNSGEIREGKLPPIQRARHKR